jgi:hypothetical protein
MYPCTDFEKKYCKISFCEKSYFSHTFLKKIFWIKKNLRNREAGGKIQRPKRKGRYQRKSRESHQDRDRGRSRRDPETGRGPRWGRTGRPRRHLCTRQGQHVEGPASTGGEESSISREWGNSAVQVRRRVMRGTGAGRAGRERPWSKVPKEGTDVGPSSSGGGHCAHGGSA